MIFHPANRPAIRISLSLSLCLMNACDYTRETDRGDDPIVRSLEIGFDKGSDLSGSDISVVLGDESNLKEMLKASRNKVVLIDYWATWCPPCVQQFPHTVALAEQHSKSDFHVISVSMNEPSDMAFVKRFLSKANARFDNLLTRYGAGSQFVESFNIRGDIPFYQLFDRTGRLRYAFSSEPEGIENCEPIEKMDSRIDELLAEPSTDPI